MSGAPREELFRPAAVAAHRAGTGPAVELETSPKLTSWAYRGLLSLVVVSIAGAFTIHVDETTAGVWIAGREPGTATLALPVGALRSLRAGQRVDLGDSRAAIRHVLPPVPVADAERRFGPLPRSLRAGDAVALAELSIGSRTGRGRATVHLGRHSLAAELVPGLRNE